VDCVLVVFRKMTVVNVKYASKLLLLAHQYFPMHCLQVAVVIHESTLYTCMRITQLTLCLHGNVLYLLCTSFRDKVEYGGPGKKHQPCRYVQLHVVGIGVDLNLFWQISGMPDAEVCNSSTYTERVQKVWKVYWVCAERGLW